MKFLFVVNAAAGRVDVSAIRDRLGREFRAHEISIVREVPPRAALEAAGPELVVVAVGGDGTVQRILRTVGTPFPGALGVVPLGTANDLARAAGLPSDFAAACAALRRRATRSIDVLEVNGIPFVTAGGIGLPAWVARRANRLRADRIFGRWIRRGGRVVYAIAACLELLGRRRFVFGRVEGGAWGRRWSAILVSNHSLLGGFRPSPNADATDGLLDLCAVEAPRARARLAWLVLRIRRGDVARCRETHTERARSTTVVTRRPTDFLGDGEVLCRGARFDVRVRPAGLPLVVPSAAPRVPQPAKPRRASSTSKEQAMRSRCCRNLRRTILPSLILLTMAIGSGCGDHTLLGPSPGDGSFGAGPPVSSPPGLTTVSLGSESISLWPYTGSGFDGSPVDPINLIFAGEADPRQIRAALMALDGDRSAFGIPPVPPFNARWTDLVGGGVQTAYTEGPLGWAGSVVQLTLGDFGPIRVHLRLFRSGHPYGKSGTWTLGGAHFEIQIPGTAEHQVVSWELAEQIVVADLIRSGLLDPAVPLQPTGPISAAPTYRTIPGVIYNGLPDELIAVIGGPPKPVTADVPIPSDGSATILNVRGSVPIASGSWSRSASVAFGQIVPKPFCVTGPGDFLMVTGPVDFVTDVSVDDGGRYSYHSSYVGHLEATPVDMSTGSPVPVGDLQVVRVDGRQSGFLDESGGRVAARDRRLVHAGEGPELWTARLVVPENGRKTYVVREHCLDADE